MKKVYISAIIASLSINLNAFAALDQKLSVAESLNSNAPQNAMNDISAFSVSTDQKAEGEIGSIMEAAARSGKDAILNKLFEAYQNFADQNTAFSRAIIGNKNFIPLLKLDLSSLRIDGRNSEAFLKYNEYKALMTEELGSTGLGVNHPMRSYINYDQDGVTISEWSNIQNRDQLIAENIFFSTHNGEERDNVTIGTTRSNAIDVTAGLANFVDEPTSTINDPSQFQFYKDLNSNPNAKEFKFAMLIAGDSVDKSFNKEYLNSVSGKNIGEGSDSNTLLTADNLADTDLSEPQYGGYQLRANSEMSILSLKAPKLIDILDYRQSNDSRYHLITQLLNYFDNRENDGGSNNSTDVNMATDLRDDANYVTNYSTVNESHMTMDGLFDLESSLFSGSFYSTDFRRNSYQNVYEYTDGEGNPQENVGYYQYTSNSIQKSNIHVVKIDDNIASIFDVNSSKNLIGKDINTTLNITLKTPTLSFNQDTQEVSYVYNGQTYTYDDNREYLEFEGLGNGTMYTEQKSQYTLGLSLASATLTAGDKIGTLTGGSLQNLQNIDLIYDNLDTSTGILTAHLSANGIQNDVASDIWGENLQWRDNYDNNVLQMALGDFNNDGIFDVVGNGMFEYQYSDHDVDNAPHIAMGIVNIGDSQI